MNNIHLNLNKIAERYANTENPDELKKDLEAMLVNLNESELLHDTKPESVTDLIKERESFFFDISKAREEFVLPSGFVDFDRDIGGWRRSELVVIGARPGMGKTQLMIDMIVRMSKQGTRCGIIALEQNKTAVLNRIISNLSLISNHKITEGVFFGNEKELVKGALKAISKLPVWIVDQQVGTISSILERCKQLVLEHSTDIIFIDYIQLIGSVHRRTNRESELALVTRMLKRFAVENNIVIVILSQLSRSVETRASGSKRPMLSDLRESGAIEQDADKVLFLYRPEYYGLTEDENGNPTKGRAEILVAKNKMGGLIDIPLYVNPNFTAFQDYTEGVNDITISENRLKDLY